MLKKVFFNKRILITGHTGFKGSWLTLYLLMQGAKILGLSKSILSRPSNFKVLKLKNKVISKKIDIRNYSKFRSEFLKFKPDFVFHLAAEAIVKKSYKNPKITWETNTLGTINLLEILRNYKRSVIVIAITSDKVYKNLEIKRPYKEGDELGGFDPYSSSKASADIAIQSYINSYFKFKKNIKISVARAGNVIGGGDWSDNRLIPDCVQSWSKGRKAMIRNPNSTRPWQFILDVISGYIYLAASLKKNRLKSNYHAFNFGPRIEKNRSVLDILKVAKKKWNRVGWVIKSNKKFFESKLLQLDSSKAKKYFNWTSKINLKKAVSFTIDWYKAYYDKKENMYEFSINQIKEFEKSKK